MSEAIIGIAILLICIGICAIIEQVKRMFFAAPELAVIRLSHLCADNAEYKLRSALFSAKGRNCVIHAVCEDEESYRICRLLAADSANCVICRKKHCRDAAPK